MAAALAAGVFTATLPMQAAPEPAAYIAEDPFVVIYSPDVPALIESWETSTVNRLMEDEAIQDFLAPAFEDDDAELPWDTLAQNWTNHALGENLELYEGAFAISLVLTDELPMEEWGDRPPMAIVGRIGADEETYQEHMDADLEQMQEDYGEGTIDEVTEDYLGVTLHLRREENEDGEMEAFEGWAIVDEVAVFGYPASVLRATVDRLVNPPTDLEWPGDWEANVDRIGLGNAFVFFDIKRLQPVWLTGLKEGLETAMESAPFGLTPESVIRAVDPAALQSISAMVRFDPDKVRFAVGGVLREKVGIWKIFAYTQSELYQPEFASQKYLRSGVASFDFGKMYDSLITMLENASPQLALMVKTQITAFQNQIGVNFRDELLAGLNDNFYFYETFRGSAEPGQELGPADIESDVGYVFSLDNQQGVETAVNTLRNFLGQGLAAFDEREYLGTAIYSSKVQIPSAQTDESLEGPAPGVEVSYALIDGYWLVGVGSSKALERILASMRDPGPTIWELPRVKAMLSELDQAPQGFEYSNMRRFVPMILDLLEQEAKKDEESVGYVDLDAMPEPEVFLRYLQGATTILFWEENGFHTTMDLFGEEE